MANLIADEFMSLDGVAQAPSYPDEDPDGGFQGGWHTPYLDEQSLQWAAGNVTAADGYLLGRRTYEIFAAHWPNAAPEEQALARPLNERPKYVVSTTLAAPLPWQNSQLLPGPDAADAVRALKAEQDGAIHVIGSTRLVQTLFAHDLIDEFRLMIDPLVIGAGKRFFSDLQAALQLNLTEHTVTSTGALLAPLTAGPVRLDGKEGPPTRTSSHPTTNKTSDSFGHLDSFTPVVNSDLLFVGNDWS